MHAVLLTVFDPAGNLAYTCPNWQFCVLSDPFGIVTAHIDLKWILAYCLGQLTLLKMCMHLFYPVGNCAYTLEPSGNSGYCFDLIWKFYMPLFGIVHIALTQLRIRQAVLMQFGTGDTVLTQL